MLSNVEALVARRARIRRRGLRYGRAGDEGARLPFHRSHPVLKWTQLVAKWRRTAPALLAGAAIYAWFLFLLRGCLSSWFDADDLMNLHYYWARPWSALARANVGILVELLSPGGGFFTGRSSPYGDFIRGPSVSPRWYCFRSTLRCLAVVVWQLTRSRWGLFIALMLVGINYVLPAYFDTGASTTFWPTPSFGAASPCMYAASSRTTARLGKSVAHSLPVRRGAGC